MKEYKIASIAGDGIGKEVVPEAQKILKEVANQHQFKLRIDEFDFSSCDYYEKHGKMLPDDWKDKIGSHDAIFFGAVGMPDRYPDHVTLWGSLLQFRREFDQFINLRPVKLFEGVNAPLANKKPGDIDMIIVRENTEGEYSSVGGRMYKDSEREIAVQETIMSRQGVDRVQKYAFELAKSKGRKKVTNATKSNGISITMPFWDERFDIMKKNYPEIKTDQFHIDILTARFVLTPEWFDVVVASNLFGDILSDLATELSGSLGLAGSLNAGSNHAMAQAQHGAAPDIADQNIANPISLILSSAMLLDWLGKNRKIDKLILASNLINNSVLELLKDKENFTRDLGGNASTSNITENLIKILKQSCYTGMATFSSFVHTLHKNLYLTIIILVCTYTVIILAVSHIVVLLLQLTM